MAGASEFRGNWFNVHALRQEQISNAKMCFVRHAEEELQTLHAISSMMLDAKNDTITGQSQRQISRLIMTIRASSLTDGREAAVSGSWATLLATEPIAVIRDQCVASSSSVRKFVSR